MFWWQSHWEVPFHLKSLQLGGCKVILYIYVYMYPAEMLCFGLLSILKSRYLHVLRRAFIFIIFSLYFFFLHFFSWMLVQNFPGNLYFIAWLYLNLVVAPFILCIFCGSLSLHFEKRRKIQTSEPENRLTGTAVVSHFQTARQDRVIRLRMTEVIVPYIQSFFDLSSFF